MYRKQEVVNIPSYNLLKKKTLIVKPPLPPYQKKKEKGKGHEDIQFDQSKIEQQPRVRAHHNEASHKYPQMARDVKMQHQITHTTKLAELEWNHLRA